MKKKIFIFNLLLIFISNCFASSNEALIGLKADVSNEIRHSQTQHAPRLRRAPAIHPGDKSPDIIATKNKNTNPFTPSPASNPKIEKMVKNDYTATEHDNTNATDQNSTIIINRNPSEEHLNKVKEIIKLDPYYKNADPLSPSPASDPENVEKIVENAYTAHDSTNKVVGFHSFYNHKTSRRSGKVCFIFVSEADPDHPLKDQIWDALKDQIWDALYNDIILRGQEDDCDLLTTTIYADEKDFKKQEAFLKEKGAEIVKNPRNPQFKIVKLPLKELL